MRIHIDTYLRGTQKHIPSAHTDTHTEVKHRNRENPTPDEIHVANPHDKYMNIYNYYLETFAKVGLCDFRLSAVTVGRTTGTM